MLASNRDFLRLGASTVPLVARMTASRAASCSSRLSPSAPPMLLESILASEAKDSSGTPRPRCLHLDVLPMTSTSHKSMSCCSLFLWWIPASHRTTDCRFTLATEHKEEEAQTGEANYLVPQLCCPIKASVIEEKLQLKADLRSVVGFPKHSLPLLLICTQHISIGRRNCHPATKILLLKHTQR